MKKITSLTAEQRAAMPAWRDKWIAIGRSTEPADRAAAERAYHDCYRLSGLRENVPVIWVQSPIVMACRGPLLAAAQREGVAAAAGAAVAAAVSEGVDAAVDAAVATAVATAVSAAVSAAVHAGVHAAADAAVSAAVSAAVHAAVHAAVSEGAGAAVHADIKNHWAEYRGGNLWAAWPAFEQFLTEVCGLELEGDIAARADASARTTAAGWWWPGHTFIVACDRPRTLLFDARDRMHCETGPAIEWRDGWGLYFWHGVRIPGEWIERRATLDPVIALTWENIEQRRCAAVIIGWDRVIAALPSRVIDQDRDPQVGTLIEIDIPDAPGSRFLRVRCATERDFVLPVPRDMQRAIDANMWTYPAAWKITEKQYRASQRT